MRIKFFAQRYALVLVGIPVGFALVCRLLGAIGVDMPLTRNVEECEKIESVQECGKW